MAKAETQVMLVEHMVADFQRSEKIVRRDTTRRHTSKVATLGVHRTARSPGERGRAETSSKKASREPHEGSVLFIPNAPLSLCVL